MVLKPLDDMYRIKKINYVTYQSVSGEGYKGIEELTFFCLSLQKIPTFSQLGLDKS